jgi:hypothetical protein
MTSATMLTAREHGSRDQEVCAMFVPVKTGKMLVQLHQPLDHMRREGAERSPIIASRLGALDLERFEPHKGSR